EVQLGQEVHQDQVSSGIGVRLEQQVDLAAIEHEAGHCEAGRYVERRTEREGEVPIKEVQLRQEVHQGQVSGGIGVRLEQQADLDVGHVEAGHAEAGRYVERRTEREGDVPIQEVQLGQEVHQDQVSSGIGVRLEQQVDLAAIEHEAGHAEAGRYVERRTEQ